MPPSSFEALSIFLLFLPGFLAERVITVLTPKKAVSALESLVNSAGLSLLIYGLYQIPVLFTSLPSLPVALAGSEGALDVSVSAPAIGVLVGLAVVVGAVIGRALESGAIYRLLSRPVLGRLGLTSLTGRPTVWEDALIENPSPLVDVYLKDGTIVSGDYVYISERPGENEILVVPPGENSGVPEGDDHRHIIITDRSGRASRPEIKGILITADAQIQRIDFNYPAPIAWGHGRRNKGRRQRRKPKG